MLEKKVIIIIRTDAVVNPISKPISFLDLDVFDFQEFMIKIPIETGTSISQTVLNSRAIFMVAKSIWNILKKIPLVSHKHRMAHATYFNILRCFCIFN